MNKECLWEGKNEIFIDYENEIDIERRLKENRNNRKYQESRIYDNKEVLKTLAFPTLVISMGVFGLGESLDLKFLSVLGVLDSLLAFGWSNCLIYGAFDGKREIKKADVLGAGLEEAKEMARLKRESNVISFMYEKERIHSNQLKTSGGKVLRFRKF